MINLPNLNQSKERQKILKLYFSNLQKRYYLRQLEKLLNISVGNIRRELLKLEKTGIFVSEKEGNLSYYSLNQQYPLFKELKSIIFKTIGIEGELKRLAKSINGVLAAFIFGSFANEQEDSLSDIDLYLVVDKKKFNEDKLVDRISRLESTVNREINYHYSDLKEFLEKKKMSSFIQSILKDKKIILINHECLG